MKNLEELFKTFCGNDEFKPVLALPFEHESIVYATEGHVMIFCNKNDYGFEVHNPHGSLKNPHALVPKENINRLLKLNKQKFERLKTVDELKKDGKDIDCRHCKGSGTVEWTFKRHTKDDDCPECEGDGLEFVAPLKPTGNKTFKECYVKLNHLYFQAKLFYKLIEASEFLNEPIYLVHLPTENKATLFKIGIVNVIIMPFLYDSTYNDNEVSIKINV